MTVENAAEPDFIQNRQNMVAPGHAALLSPSNYDKTTLSFSH